MELNIWVSAILFNLVVSSFPIHFPRWKEKAFIYRYCDAPSNGTNIRDDLTDHKEQNISLNGDHP